MILPLSDSKLVPWPTGQCCKWSFALDGLFPDEIDAIGMRLRRKSYAPRTTIFKQGSVADSMLICEHGRMRMYHCNEQGEEFTLFLQDDDYTVGLPSALLGQPRMVTVESVEGTVMLSLAREDLFYFMQSMPRFAINIAKLLAGLHRESVYTTSPLVLDSASTRLGKVLARVAVPHNDAKLGNYYTVTGLNHDDLASMVGVSRTWLSLMLSTMEKNRLLWRGRLMIGIYDLRRLLDHCASIRAKT